MEDAPSGPLPLADRVQQPSGAADCRKIFVGPQIQHIVQRLQQLVPLSMQAGDYGPEAIDFVLLSLALSQYAFDRFDGVLRQVDIAHAPPQDEREHMLMIAHLKLGSQSLDPAGDRRLCFTQHWVVSIMTFSL